MNRARKRREIRELRCFFFCLSFLFFPFLLSPRRFSSSTTPHLHPRVAPACDFGHLRAEKRRREVSCGEKNEQARKEKPAATTMAIERKRESFSSLSQAQQSAIEADSRGGLAQAEARGSRRRQRERVLGSLDEGRGRK